MSEFNWRGRGYRWSEPAFDLLADSALQHDEPWVVVGAVVARAKMGDSSEAPILARFFDRRDGVIGDVSLAIFGDIAGSSDLFLLNEALAHEDPDVRQCAASAASRTGQLSLVPAMVDAWNTASGDDHEGIGFSITNIVENQEVTTKLMGKVGSFNTYLDPECANSPNERRMVEMSNRISEEAGPPEFPGMVLEAYDRLVSQHGSNANLWQGELICLRHLLRRIMDSAAMDYILLGRLDTMTGLHLFGDSGERALQTLKEQLESPLAYRIGQRYFWGHALM